MFSGFSSLNVDVKKKESKFLYRVVKRYFSFFVSYVQCSEKKRGRNISTVVKDAVSGLNRKETLLTSERLSEKHSLLYSDSQGCLLTFTFIFPFYAHCLNINRIYFLLSGRHKIQREVIGSEIKGAVFLILWNIPPLSFLSHILSEQANF